MADFSQWNFSPPMEKFNHCTHWKKHSLQKSRLHTIPSLWSPISVFLFCKHMKFLAIISDGNGKGRKRKALAWIPDDYDGLAINISETETHYRLCDVNTILILPLYLVTIHNNTGWFIMWELWRGAEFLTPKYALLTKRLFLKLQT